MTEASKKLQKLRYWREIIGLTQAQVATLLGQTVGTYCLKENGKAEIRLTEMLTIQNAFNEKLVSSGRDPIKLDDIFVS